MQPKAVLHRVEATLTHISAPRVLSEGNLNLLVLLSQHSGDLDCAALVSSGLIRHHIGNFNAAIQLSKCETLTDDR